ncbi:DUF2914 domain-containing protein [candidate division KSB1 bacterium]|nr:DUF2914 domain-containing protein [candidate division KSB1 bacterium]NIT73335.1 DUF2914 domain-containing protein [candidate division KSB1 bacterium]NIX73015.1 DUF2914 domain-containing protein [candidate division KSB1 bacterium]
MASFSFFIFFIPVALKKMNLLTFIFGGILSLLLVAGLLTILRRESVFPNQRQFQAAIAGVLSLYTLVNVFYWQNWIPPVPLSLKEAGIYHHVSKNNETDLYTLQFQKPRWYQFFKDSDSPFRYAGGDTVHCFTAVFAPTKLTKKIYHHWQKYFPNRDEWLTTDRLGYKITGYRDSGYRGYTHKVNVSPGKWRVDVETARGIILGRIKFKIREVGERVPLKTIYR